MKLSTLWAALAFSLSIPTLSWAEAPPASPAAEPAQDPAWAAAEAAMIRGPNTVELRDQAKLALPKGYGFIPRTEGKVAMEAMGNSVGDEFLGLITPLDGGDWLVTLDFLKEGYIKDDDAKDWDAKELLDSLKKGTEESNEFRVKQGAKALEVTGWVEKPAYDQGSHRLVWSVAAKHKGEPDSPDSTVNYNTYVLGREGYVSLDLITNKSLIESQKSVARELLGAVAFNPGKSYGDFDKKTDHVAEYGLAALVGGVALKKLGLFAIMAAFAAKFIKIIAVAAFGLLAGFKKFFGKKTE